MKKMLCVIIAFSIVLVFTACVNRDSNSSESLNKDIANSSTSKSPDVSPSDSEEEKDEVTLTIFAAASMTETINEIVETYNEMAPHVTIVCNYDSSGTLVTQIEEGADCDIFISAAQKQMNEIDLTYDESANPDKYDFVLQGTRVDLLENKVTLVVPDGNPAGIESFEDLATDKLSLLAIGNSDVPVGQYSEQILEYLGIGEALESEGKITYGSNVKEVTTQVSEATVDCGIIYATDAYSAGLAVVCEATEEMCSKVVYPAAVLSITKNESEARAFLEYLQTDECSQIFEEVGFSIVK